MDLAFLFLLILFVTVLVMVLVTAPRGATPARAVGESLRSLRHTLLDAVAWLRRHLPWRPAGQSMRHQDSDRIKQRLGLEPPAEGKTVLPSAAVPPTTFVAPPPGRRQAEAPAAVPASIAADSVASSVPVAVTAAPTGPPAPNTLDWPADLPALASLATVTIPPGAGCGVIQGAGLPSFAALLKQST